jgi:hypothetical protein
MLVVLIAALIAVGAAGLGGLSNLNSNVKTLYGDHVLTLERASALATDTAGRSESLSRSSFPPTRSRSRISNLN